MWRRLHGRDETWPQYGAVRAWLLAHGGVHGTSVTSRHPPHHGNDAEIGRRGANVENTAIAERAVTHAVGVTAEKKGDTRRELRNQVEVVAEGSPVRCSDAHQAGAETNSQDARAVHFEFSAAFRGIENPR